MEEKIRVLELGIYLISIVGLWGIVIWTGFTNWRREKKLYGKEEKQSFYFGKQGSDNSFATKQRDIDVFSFLFMCIVTIFVTALVSYIVNLPELNLRYLWNGTGKYVDDIPGEMFSGLSLVTLVTTLVGFNKKTWFGFNINEILKEFSIIKNVKIMLIMTCIRKILDFFAPVVQNRFGYTAYFTVRMLIVISFWIYLVLLIRNVWVIIEILFGKKIDRFCAKNLHRFLCVEASVLNKRNYEMVEFENVISYLLCGYKKSMKKINFKKLVTISFDSNITPQGTRFKKNKIWATLIMAVIMLVLTTIITVNVFEDYTKWTFQVIPLIISPILFAVLGIFNSGFGGLFVSICYGWVSYQFCYKSRSKYAREVAIISNRKYCKSVQSVENILAVYKIALRQKGTDASKRIIRYCMNERDVLKKSRPEEGDMMQLLLIAMDYINYCETSNTTKIFVFSKEDKCIELAKGFAIKGTKSIVGDQIDEDKYNKYLEVKAKEYSR